MTAPTERLWDAASEAPALSSLSRRIGPSKLITASDRCDAYTMDDSDFVGRRPIGVVLAETAEDISATLEIANKFGIPVTPRGGGTSRVGGAVPVLGGLVLCTSGMKTIKSIDRSEMLAVVQPGVMLEDLHQAAEAEGLFYPPDPNSLKICTVGGNVASNAGGPRAFKYGVTGDYVLGMEAHLMSGTQLKLGRRTRKGVTGYDLTHLLVGSEGTLGVVSEVTLRLVPKPEHVFTVLALFKDPVDAGRCVEAIIAAHLVPRCIELLDSGTLGAMRAAGNSIDESANAMLLMELDGEEGAVERAGETLGNLCSDVGAISVVAAQSASQRDRLWDARRAMSPAVRRMAKHKLSEDVVVPTQRVGELLSQVRVSSERIGFRTVSYGHAGDGNLHVNFLWDTDQERLLVNRGIEQLFKDVMTLGGTLSGEHGIGMSKAPFLHYEQSPALIALQKQIKQTFDPKGLLNPGKIFPSGPSHGIC